MEIVTITPPNGVCNESHRWVTALVMGTAKRSVGVTVIYVKIDSVSDRIELSRSLSCLFFLNREPLKKIAETYI